MFKNYEAGEPTCRLYVKNIAKQVEETVGSFLTLPCALPFFGFDAHLRNQFHHQKFISNVFQDLKYIYGRYIDPSSEEERNMYVKFSLDGFDFFHTACVSHQLVLLLQLFLTPAICHFPLRVFSNSC